MGAIAVIPETKTTKRLKPQRTDPLLLKMLPRIHWLHCQCDCCQSQVFYADLVRGNESLLKRGRLLLCHLVHSSLPSLRLDSTIAVDNAGLEADYDVCLFGLTIVRFPPAGLHLLGLT